MLGRRLQRTEATDPVPSRDVALCALLRLGIYAKSCPDFLLQKAEDSRIFFCEGPSSDYGKRMPAQ